MSIQPPQPLWGLYDLSSRCIRSRWCLDWCICIWRVWIKWLGMNDGCSYEESSHARFCVTTCASLSACILHPRSKEHTHYRALVRQQAGDLPDVDRLECQHGDPLFFPLALAENSDLLVSFSSLNEHNLALSGCWITLKEYKLPSAFHTERVGLRFMLLGPMPRVWIDWESIIWTDSTSFFWVSIMSILMLIVFTVLVIEWIDSSRCHNRYVCRFMDPRYIVVAMVIW